MGRLTVAVLICSMLLCTAAAAQTLDRITAGGTVRIGYIAGQKPFAWAESGAGPQGYSIDLCNAVVDEIGRNLRGLRRVYVPVSLTEAFDAVAADQIDLLCGAISITLERRQKVDFSEPIFVTGMSAVLRKDSPRDLKELFTGERTISPPRSPELRPFATSKIGVRAASTTEVVLREAILQGHYGAEVVALDSHADGIAALQARAIDAYFADRALLIGAVADAHDNDLVLSPRLLSHDFYGIAMKRGDADLRLLVDRTLSAYYAMPQFSALASKYFGGEADEIQAQIRAEALPQ